MWVALFKLEILQSGAWAGQIGKQDNNLENMP